MPGNDIKRKTRLRNVLILTGIILITTIVILFIIPPLNPDGIFIILSALLVVDLLLIMTIYVKIYQLSLVFIAIITLGIIFRSQRFPLSGLLFSLGFGGLSLSSVSVSFYFLRRFRDLPFLRYFGFSSSIILGIVSFGFLVKVMHWGGARIFLSGGTSLFVILLFAFIFTMPGSNFINWNKDQRQVFYSSIIIPMVFLFIISIMIVVFPEIWTILLRQPLTPFWMNEFELMQKPGLY